MSYPTPPMVKDWKMRPPKELFPPYPRMLEDSKKYGGLFTYSLPGGRRMTVLTDVPTYPIIFAPDQFGLRNDDTRMKNVGDSIKMEMDKVGHAWFGIPKEVVVHQRPGLDELRKRVLNPTACRRLNDMIGADMDKQFKALPNTGVTELVNIACATFPGVNASMFGPKTVPPKAEEEFFGFDEEVARATLGLPKTKKYWEHHGKITDMFLQSLHDGATPDKCPATAARMSVLEGKGFSDEDRAKFMVSIFWAPQANTLPMTFWCLAHVLKNPVWKEKIRQEAVAARLGEDGKYLVDLTDNSCLPFSRAVLNEVMRLYIANLTIRRVTKDCDVTLSTGQTYHLPKNHMLILTSYTTHYDEKLFPEPLKFNPERWIDKNGLLDEKQFPNNTFIPFGKGRFQCSGKHLAMLEVPTLIALFLRDFDAELMGELPEPDWDYVVASVRPKGWPHKFSLPIRYTRRQKSARL
eukprot:TRINITY_DN30687_c0_g1_i1.p1 TRINITY_DN30687_c0_g1~~TRINITY_DN30687_c0_g1_i1.p1  ORF type:complete len:464 (+),score=129.74 TRINITY_DN30687_c0_g1_i1:61-1452(+)